ncbi:hypothetical protein SAMN04489762_1227 [Terribacillus saccharophilus]|uniref:GRAM domain-containing protein n=1 Tax=Terribacillus saccharophilus TaxID=361277 RepID=A0AAX2EDM1_9BACI|nr:hypothetical protein SAMN04489762_1227 [Terribacillus saccharophilus]
MNIRNKVTIIPKFTEITMDGIDYEYLSGTFIRKANGIVLYFDTIEHANMFSDVLKFTEVINLLLFKRGEETIQGFGGPLIIKSLEGTRVFLGK